MTTIAYIAVSTDLSMVTKLDLSNNFITDIGMKAFAAGISQFKGLEEIHLESNLIGTSGVNELASVLNHLSKLKVLNLNENTITDVDALTKAARENTLENLLILQLQRNNINFVSMELLANVIRDGCMPSLQDLWVDSFENNAPVPTRYKKVVNVYSSKQYGKIFVSPTQSSS